MESAPEQEIPKVSPEQTRNAFQNHSYEIEGNKINVAWKEFSPVSEDASRDEAILFFPGWSAKAAPTLDNLVQNFADDSGKTALSVTTMLEKVIPNSLFQEAAAIRNMIVEKGLKKVILAAHSEGGAKAVNLISILQQENQNVEVEGLILLNPVGLYEQGKMELASKFILDALVKTTGSLIEHPSLAIKGLQVSSDIIFNIVREMGSAKIVGYPKKLLNQIGEMAKANTHYADVKCPVVLIQGADDPVSSPDRTIAKEDGKNLGSVWSDKRNQIVKETFFRNSSEVHWLVPEKIGHHGMPHFRPESIANASIGLLKRYWRKTLA